MKNSKPVNNPEEEQSGNSTVVDFVDINNAKWDGVVKSDSGGYVATINVTVNSITRLFLRSSGILLNT